MKTRKSNNLNKSMLLLIILIIVALSISHHRLSLCHVSAKEFDPYKLNGGLVAAVAGRDFVLIASDTRLTDGGYGVMSRRYLSGRIWSASSSLSAIISSPVPTYVSSSSPASSSWRRIPLNWDVDGSLSLPSFRNTNNNMELEAITQKEQQRTLARMEGFPVLVGSAGCASDCEALKRRVRLELDSLESSFSTSSSSFTWEDASFPVLQSPGASLWVHSVASLVQQILYGRRGFPFYSFCVVAGIDENNHQNIDPPDDVSSSNNFKEPMGTGAVYVYDAIGSYERVAVGSAGTGRELLQPILDRLFSESSQRNASYQQNQKSNQMDIQRVQIRRDSMAVPVANQRMGAAGSLRPPVQTFVNCSWEEAVNNVATAYRSVAEREISVGDEVVICLVKISKENNRYCAMDVFNFPLKRH